MNTFLLADVARSPLDFSVAVIGFALAAPAGLVLGSVAYLVLASRAAKRGDTAERHLPVWRQKLWWRSVKYVAAIVFVGVVVTMTASFYTSRDVNRDRRDREYRQQTSAPSARPPSALPPSALPSAAPPAAPSPAPAPS